MCCQVDSSHEDTIVRRGGGDANDDDDSDELYIHACEREHCYSFRGGFHSFVYLEKHCFNAGEHHWDLPLQVGFLIAFPHVKSLTVPHA